MAIRKLALLIAAVVLFGGDLQASKFESAGGEEPVIGRYVVTLETPPADPEGEARVIATLYGARLESQATEDQQSFAVMMPPARARVLSTDGRVRSVIEVRAEPETPKPVDEPARPPVRIVPAAVGEERRLYTYDGSGNVKSIADPIGQVTDNFAYDTAGRLIIGVTDGSRQEFSYDAFGNRTNAVLASGAIPCLGGTTCGGALPVDGTTNHLNGAGAAVYDAAGSLTQLNSGTQYTYDALGMMRSSNTSSGLDQREYIYTADDERLAVRRSSGTDWTIRRLDAKPLRDFTESAGTLTWSADHVWRGSHLLATVSRAVDGTTATHHYHLDHLGTPRLITDGNGVEVARHSYYAFGPELQITPHESPELRLKFTGHERDLIAGNASSLDYMHARYYSATMGRFLSVDPVLDIKRSIREPQSWNRYSYVVNNPIRRIDPDGRVDGNSDDFARQLFPNDRAAQLAFDQEVAAKTAGLSAAFGSLFIPGPEDVAIGAFIGSRVGGAAVRFFGRLLGRGDAAADLGKASRYDDVTTGRSVPNRATDVSRADFGKNLEANGFSKSVSKDGKVTIYEKGGVKYTVRDTAKSTGGPTAEVFKDGKLVEKIRLEVQ